MIASADAITIIPSSINSSVKTFITGTLVYTGQVRVGWFTKNLPTGRIDAPAYALAPYMTFLGGGGNAGTSTLTLNNGQISGSISGFNPSSTGDSSFANKQLWVLILDAPPGVSLADVPETTPWALFTKPATLGWNTGSVATATKGLAISALTSSDVFRGKLEVDGQFVNGATATTGIGLVPWIGDAPWTGLPVPEPSSALLVGFSCLLGLRRRRGKADAAEMPA